MNIYQKMDAITNELGVIAKDLEVSLGKRGGYKAVGERQILDAVKPLENKYGVYSYPCKRAVEDSEVVISEKEYSGNITKANNFLLRISTVYRFVNVDDPEDYIEVGTYGDGIDTGDKAPGKAMTYADKYALMKAYKISTGDDPDQEGSPERGYSKRNTANTKKYKTYDITEAQASFFDAYQDKERITNMLKYYKVNSVLDLTEAQAKEAIERLKK